jgi:hypothetical protein
MPDEIKLRLKDMDVDLKAAKETILEKEKTIHDMTLKTQSLQEKLVESDNFIGKFIGIFSFS